MFSHKTAFNSGALWDVLHVALMSGNIMTVIVVVIIPGSQSHSSLGRSNMRVFLSLEICEGAVKSRSFVLYITRISGGGLSPVSGDPEQDPMMSKVIVPSVRPCRRVTKRSLSVATGGFCFSCWLINHAKCLFAEERDGRGVKQTEGAIRRTGI